MILALLRVRLRGDPTFSEGIFGFFDVTVYLCVFIQQVAASTITPGMGN